MTLSDLQGYSLTVSFPDAIFRTVMQQRRRFQKKNN